MEEIRQFGVRPAGEAAINLIISELKLLKEPSPRLDVEIYFHTQCRRTPAGYIFLGQEICPHTFPWIHPNGSPTNAGMAHAPAYTRSVDDALLLKPEGYRLQLSEWDDESLRELGPWQAILTPPGKRGDFDEWWPRTDHAYNPAIAICIASLLTKLK